MTLRAVTTSTILIQAKEYYYFLLWNLAFKKI